MRKLYPNSRIEIWDMAYINNGNRRQEADKNVDIVQIEYACGDGYIVELVEKAEIEEISDIAERIKEGEPICR